MTPMNETVVLSKDYTISVVDYIVLVLVLLVSLGIGIFYSCRQKTPEEYLQGGRQMALIPVSISLVVSYISAITMQGLTAEIYIYGIDMLGENLGVLGVLAVTFTIVPLFYELKPTTVFQYLQLRFQSKIPSVIGSLVSLIGLLVYAGAVTYGPAAAVESFLKTPTVYNILIISVVCTIYTCIGGIKAVVWTDVLQATIMVAGLLLVLILGLARMGIDAVAEELSKSGRTHLSLNPNITQRYNLWMGVFSNGSLLFCVFIRQVSMVRYTGLATLKQAKMSAVLSGVSYCFILSLAMFAGAVIFTHYSQLGCGPLEAGVIYTSNQIAPYYVITELNYPGIPGLFISAIVASSLSTISSIQNALSAVVWRDLLSPFMPNLSDLKKTFVLKLLVAVIGAGITGVALGFMVTTSTLMAITTAISSAVTSPMLGIFILAAFFPWVGIRAGLIGWICSSSFCMWICLGKIFYGTQWDKPDMVNAKCPLPYASNTSDYLLSNSTHQEASTAKFDMEEGPSLFAMYSISHYSYYGLGLGITVAVALIMSVIPAFRQKKAFDAKLVVPFMRRYVRKSDVMHDSENMKPSSAKPLIEALAQEKCKQTVF